MTTIKLYCCSLLLSLCCFYSPVVAEQRMDLSGSESEPVQLLPNTSTMYDRVDALYRNGQQLDLTTRIGFSVGRCFRQENPNKAIAGALNIDIDESAGPLGDKPFIGMMYWEHEIPANLLDDLTYRELLERYYTPDLRYINEDTNDKSHYVNGNVRGYYFEFRVNGNYIALRGHKDNDIFAVCYLYLFKRKN